MGKHTRRLRRLHGADPHCHWCGAETVIGAVTFAGRAAAKAATIDHVYGRLTPERRAGNKSCVLACSGCNQWRNNVEAKVRSPDPSVRGQGRRMARNPGRAFLRDPLAHLPPELFLAA